MRIEKVILHGFRSFGDTQTLDLSNMTALIGGNGVGKTSFLLALNRLFGVTQKDRAIANEDFYVKPGEKIDDVSERKLSIEVKVSFPELVTTGANLDSVAECFKNMIVDEQPGSTAIPYCRIRLEAVYTRDLLGEGDIRPKVFWVKSPYVAVGTPQEEVTIDLSASDRQRIKVIYAPASRDPSAQLQEFSGSLIGNFVKSIKWQVDPETTLKSAVTGAKDTLAREKGVKTINETVGKRWSNLSPSFRSASPKLNFIDDDVKKMLKNVSMNFDNGSEKTASKIHELSDGEKSLFYFSLLQSALSLKESFLTSEQIKIDNEIVAISDVFQQSKLDFPNLTILAIEEPENHLSPHHFGHLIESFKTLAVANSSQVLFTSHSASIISRVAPEEIRYFKINDFKTSIKKITLPAAADEAFTYVKEAIKAYPELYFSKIVVLGEGDSEEVILKRLFTAKGLPLDRSMISIVPLGGRFVNHFWRLLNELEIPFVTLLDLDLGKLGGGWERVGYCVDQLIKLGVPQNTLFQDSNNPPDFKTFQLTTPQHYTDLQSWLDFLQNSYAVFFSRNLDVDYLMLEAFFSFYSNLIKPPDRGPAPLPTDNSPDYLVKVDQLEKAIFGDGPVPRIYNPQLLNYYRYFFLGKGKPLTHNLALTSIPHGDFTQKCPKILSDLADSVWRKLSPPANLPNNQAT